MRRRLRMDVSESDHVLVFVDDVGRDFAVGDLTENGIRHRCNLLRQETSGVRVGADR